ncbi:MAG: DUF1549 domain-containing protein, partial [Planctomycetaceae bacterium]|nr:DUF1549 domain-containing protein [Planctomycetaceae bacterium]
MLLWAGLTGTTPGIAETNKIPGKQAAKTPVDFTQEVQPLLAKHCYSCHGPDVQEGGLRLDQSELAFKKLESEATAVVPNHPEQSELIARITSKDDSLQMPPEGERLKPEQIDILKNWIQQGAEWKKHWAFQPPERKNPPEPNQSQWVKNPIDAFILAGLEAKGLSPAPAADRVALIRRVYFDLTGLPPTPEEVDQFVNDS